MRRLARDVTILDEKWLAAHCDSSDGIDILLAGFPFYPSFGVGVASMSRL